MPSLVAVAVCSIDYLTPNIKIFTNLQLDVETTDDSEPDEESPTQKASKQIVGPSKQTDAHRQAQPNHGRFVVEITPTKPVRGPTSSKSEYPLYFSSSTNVSDSLV